MNASSQRGNDRCLYGIRGMTALTPFVEGISLSGPAIRMAGAYTTALWPEPLPPEGYAALHRPSTEAQIPKLGPSAQSG
jgi:hypothetical protein